MGFDGNIQLSENLTSLGYYAFQGCSSLTGQLKIPGGLKVLERNVFGGCKSLGSLVIQEGVELVCESAFEGCSSLKGTLVLPKSIKIIGDRAFESCRSLTGRLVLPEGVTSIGKESFAYCESITALQLPQSLLSIGKNAFIKNTSLSGELTIPDSVTFIGDGAFSKDNLITGLRIGKAVCSIGSKAFKDCTSIKKALLTGDLPDYYTEEEKSSFPQGCSLSFRNGALSLSEKWASLKKKSRDEKQLKKSTDESSTGKGSAKDQPYYWTQSLTNRDFRAAKEFADVTLSFNDSLVTLYVNGREFDSAEYTADPDDYKNKLIEIDSLYSRNGEITRMEYFEKKSMGLIKATYTDWNGKESTMSFHTGSQETVPLFAMGE